MSFGTEMTPRIGITTYVERARWGSWDRAAALLPHSYVTAVADGGAVPVLLPPLADGAEVALDGIDGLLVSGGADLDPGIYGQDPRPETDDPRRDRDAWETALLRGALDRDLPVLAVCRGIQVLNVVRGGTLHQHLPDVCGHDGHRPELGVYGTTEVAITSTSRLAALVGSTAIVPCHHHQAIDMVGEGVEISARATDGTVEAVELPGHRFVLGVQWHPEDDDDRRLFHALAAASAAQR